MMAVNIKEELFKEAARIEEDALHSGKSHLNAAAFWQKVHLGLGLPMTILAGWAGLEAFKSNPECAALLAILSAGLGAASTFLNPNDKASAHRNTGNQYLSLKNQARFFRNIDLKALADEESIKIIRELSERRNNLNESSLVIPDWAYKFATKDINEGRHKYEIDKEGV